ncbi:hypothetical protein RGQ29_002508 [Quercus rubra]|uniref:RNase H type-1 domain-containing protein n=1 Tax=Quercus rubra TaxID=3512 RepID=A0AAN7E9Y8_QUERU|nr:hypothetical protein RGQ29_002508 [Quercus rubra]
MPSYVMQGCVLPSRVLNGLDRINRNFIRGSTEEEKRMHLVNWGKVTKPKAKGGLGLQEAKGRNLALVAKLCWRMESSNIAKWAEVLKIKYRRRAEPSKRAKSRIWAAVTKGIRVCEKGTKWSIGSNSNLSFWNDKWLNTGTIRSLIEGPLIRGEEELLRIILTQRGIAGLGGCDVCLSVCEDILHVLRDCHAAKVFGNSARCPQTLLNSFTFDLESWITANAKSLLKAESRDYPWCTFFLLGIWNLGLHRNLRVFKQQAVNPCLLRTVEMQVREYFYCVKGLGDNKSNTSKEVRWLKLGSGWLKLNMDGYVVGDSGIAGCGGLIRDTAELFALREGLALCVELQAQAVEVELDASAAISLISRNFTTNGDLSVLVDDCRDFLLQLPQARMIHCYREANCYADALAKLGATSSSGCNCFESPPPIVTLFLLADSLGTARTRVVPFVACNSSS